MGTFDVQTLVILINEKVPKLSLKNLFSGFQSPLVASKINTSSVGSPIFLGGRNFTNFKISTYYLSDNMSRSSVSSDEIKFMCGNPVVEHTEGIIHIFKKKSCKENIDTSQTSDLLCMLGIPSNINVKDLLNFTASMRDGISELKIVQCGLIGHFMALIKLKSQDDADQFYKTFNGTPFNSLEPDVCQLAYVSYVQAISASLGASFPMSELVELPSCPVCLEKLDEPVEGILTTILCNHSFHDDCICKTTGTVCPVCRYVQSPDIIADSKCADCDLRENLWICLICGNLGCGRYGHKHAHRHFQETGHTFALEVGQNHVWDYSDDAFVQRLAINQEDGKLVQVGEGSETGDKKADHLSMEFSAILISQLESQRLYFEAQLDAISAESAERTAKLEANLDKALTSISQLDAKIVNLSKEKNSLTQKLNHANQTTQRLQSQLLEERALVSSLSSGQTVWEARAKKAEAAAEQANEEVRDLMLNFQIHDKLAEEMTSEEMAASEISLSSSSRRRRRKNKN